MKKVKSLIFFLFLPLATTVFAAAPQNQTSSSTFVVNSQNGVNDSIESGINVTIENAYVDALFGERGKEGVGVTQLKPTISAKIFKETFLPPNTSTGEIRAFQGAYAWAANGSDNSLSRINVFKGERTDFPIDTLNLPEGLGFSPDKTRLYVSNKGDNVITVVDALTGEKITSFLSGTGKNIAVLADPTNGKIFVSDISGKKVYAHDPVSFAEIGAADFGGNTLTNLKLAYSCKDHRVFVSCEEDVVKALNPNTYAIEAEDISDGATSSPYGEFCDGDNVYFVNSEGDSVSEIASATKQINHTYHDPDGFTPISVAVDRQILLSFFRRVLATANPAVVFDDEKNGGVNGVGGTSTFFLVDEFGNLIDTTHLSYSASPYWIDLIPQGTISIQAKGKKNKLLTETDYFNKLTWSEPSNGNFATEYWIYRNGQLLASVSGATFSYEDHNLKQGKRYFYTVQAVTGDDVIYAEGSLFAEVK